MTAPATARQLEARHQLRAARAALPRLAAPRYPAGWPGTPTPVTVVARKVAFNPAAAVWLPADDPHVPAHLVALEDVGLVWLVCGGTKDDGVVSTAGRARNLGAFFCVGCWTRPKAVR